MSSTDIYYHYVYRITNTVEKKYYYGKRSSKIEPKLDLGIKYFSSSTDEEFILDQKENAQNYKYKIIGIFKDKKFALLRESKLHNRFDVGVNKNFYNKAKQTFDGFDITGKNWYTNTVTNKTRKFYPGKELPNFLVGRFIKRDSLDKMKTANLGKSWYYNPVTKENKVLKESEVPTDWIKGRILNPLTEESLSSMKDKQKNARLKFSKDISKYNAYLLNMLNKRKIVQEEKNNIMIKTLGFDSEYEFLIEIMYDVNVKNLCLTQLNKKYYYSRPDISYPKIEYFLRLYGLIPIKGKTGPKTKHNYATISPRASQTTPPT
jgi:hypothetical protein